jgi:AraC-like DNA-binding protein
MDALSEFLSAVRVEGSLFSRAELCAPWGVSTRGGEAGAGIFHAVIAGAGQLIVDGEPDRSFRAGDLLVMPHGHAHVLRHAPGAPVRHIADYPAEQDDGLPCLRGGGEGAPTSLLCGSFRFDAEGRTALLPLLPPVIHVQGGSGGTAAWLDGPLRQMSDELASGRPGGAVMVARLADLLFVHVIRAWVEQLAQEAGMSRSAFFARFTDVVGEPPAAYLTRWRMTVARARLRRTQAGMAEVAEAIGYGSEAAFSRAFKRHVGQAPSVWRRASRAN